MCGPSCSSPADPFVQHRGPAFTEESGAEEAIWVVGKGTDVRESRFVLLVPFVSSLLIPCYSPARLVEVLVSVSISVFAVVGGGIESDPLCIIPFNGFSFEDFHSSAANAQPLELFPYKQRCCRQVSQVSTYDVTRMKAGEVTHRSGWSRCFVMLPRGSLPSQEPNMPFRHPRLHTRTRSRHDPDWSTLLPRSQLPNHTPS